MREEVQLCRQALTLARWSWVLQQKAFSSWIYSVSVREELLVGHPSLADPGQAGQNSRTAVSFPFASCGTTSWAAHVQRRHQTEHLSERASPAFVSTEVLWRSSQTFYWRFDAAYCRRGQPRVSAHTAHHTHLMSTKTALVLIAQGSEEIELCAIRYSNTSRS